jgi:hypothetical protein
MQIQNKNKPQTCDLEKIKEEEPQRVEGSDTSSE